MSGKVFCNIREPERQLDTSVIYRPMYNSSILYSGRFINTAVKKTQSNTHYYKQRKKHIKRLNQSKQWGETYCMLMTQLYLNKDVKCITNAYTHHGHGLSYVMAFRRSPIFTKSHTHAYICVWQCGWKQSRKHSTNILQPFCVSFHCIY